MESVWLFIPQHCLMGVTVGLWGKPWQCSQGKFHFLFFYLSVYNFILVTSLGCWIDTFLSMCLHKSCFFEEVYCAIGERVSCLLVCFSWNQCFCREKGLNGDALRNLALWLWPRQVLLMMSMVLSCSMSEFLSETDKCWAFKAAHGLFTRIHDIIFDSESLNILAPLGLSEHAVARGAWGRCSADVSFRTWWTHGGRVSLWQVLA